MSEFTHPRRRGGSFRLDFDNQENPYREDDSSPVQFLTPYYESQDRPEPLDLSRLKLDNIDSGYDNENDQDEEEDDEEAREELIRTRGRSRSRSIHVNDAGAAPYLPQSEGQPIIEDPNNKSKSKQRNGPIDRSGPLPHREVATLQKVRIFLQLSLKLLLSSLFFICRDWKKLRKFIQRPKPVKMKKNAWQLMPKNENACWQQRINAKQIKSPPIVNLPEG